MRAMFVVLLSVFAMFVSSPAIAQDMSAEEHFNQAEALFKIRDYEQALVHYKAAYLASLAPELLFNMAQCYRFLGKYEDALGTYKTFLRELPDTTMKSDVENIMKEVEDLLIKQKSTQAATPMGSLNPNITSESQPSSRATDPNPNTSKETPEVVKAPTDKPLNPNIPKYILFGAGGAIATSFILGGVSLSMAKKSAAAQLEGKPASEFSQTFRSSQVLAGTSTALLIGAVLAGGTGALLFVKSKSTKTEVGILFSPSSLALQASF
jgi:tetratricopeptide (TPR) repeat protein